MLGKRSLFEVLMYIIGYDIVSAKNYIEKKISDIHKLITK